MQRVLEHIGVEEPEAAPTHFSRPAMAWSLIVALYTLNFVRLMLPVERLAKATESDAGRDFTGSEWHYDAWLGSGVTPRMDPEVVAASFFSLPFLIFGGLVTYLASLLFIAPRATPSGRSAMVVVVLVQLAVFLWFRDAIDVVTALRWLRD